MNKVIKPMPEPKFQVGEVVKVVWYTEIFIGRIQYIRGHLSSNQELMSWSYSLEGRATELFESDIKKI